MRDRKNLLWAAAAGGAFLLVVVLLASRGCSDDKDKQAGATPASFDDLEDGWKAAGLSPGGFAPIDGQALGNGQCKAGAVNGLDVTVCEYSGPELAQVSRPSGLAAVGVATGAAVVAGKRMLIVADRKKADPSGRSIDKIIKVFEGKPLVRPSPPKGDRKAPSAPK